MDSVAVRVSGPGESFSRRNHVGLVVNRAIFHCDYDPAYSTLNFMASTVWTLTGAWVGHLLMEIEIPRREFAKGLAAVPRHSFSASLSVLDNGCQAQKPGADFQVCAFRDVGVDLKVDPVFP
jgi:hypothetical protein